MLSPKLRMDVKKIDGKHYICMEDMLKDIEDYDADYLTDEQVYTVEKVTRWLNALISHYDRTYSDTDEYLPRLTRRQAAVIGAATGYLVGDFADMHDYIEEVMGRPVQTIEMALDETVSEIKAAAKPDLLKICNEG